MNSLKIGIFFLPLPFVVSAMEIREEKQSIPERFFEFHYGVVDHIPRKFMQDFSLFKYRLEPEPDFFFNTYRKTKKQYDRLNVVQTLGNALQKLLDEPLPSKLNILMIRCDGVLLHQGQCRYFDNSLSTPENVRLLWDYGFSSVQEFEEWGNELFKVPYSKDSPFYQSLILLEEYVPEQLRKLHEMGYEIFCYYPGYNPNPEEEKGYLDFAGIDFTSLNKLKIPLLPSSDLYNEDDKEPMVSLPYRTDPPAYFLHRLAHGRAYQEIYESPQEASFTVIDDCPDTLFNSFATVNYQGKHKIEAIPAVIKRGVWVTLSSVINQNYKPCENSIIKQKGTSVLKNLLEKFRAPSAPAYLKNSIGILHPSDQDIAAMAMLKHYKILNPSKDEFVATIYLLYQGYLNQIIPFYSDSPWQRDKVCKENFLKIKITANLLAQGNKTPSSKQINEEINNFLKRESQYINLDSKTFLPPHGTVLQFKPLRLKIRKLGTFSGVEERLTNLMNFINREDVYVTDLCVGVENQPMSKHCTTILIEGLKKNASLTSLSLPYFLLNSKKAPQMGDVLRINKSLAHLTISGDPIDDNALASIADAVRTNPSFQTLNLSDNRRIGNKGATHIANALMYHPSLKVLNLSLNDIGDKGAKQLANALAENTSLLDLNVKHNDMGPEGIQTLLHAVTTHPSLKSLAINMYQENLPDIGELLTKNSCLERLSFSGSIHGKGNFKNLENITEALKTNHSLKSLTLYSIDLKAKSVQQLADMLKVNTTLTELGLEYIQLRSIDALVLAEGLRAHKALKSLTLNDFYPLLNDKSKETLLYLIKALKDNATLQNLTILHTIGLEEAQALSDVLRTSPSLIILNLNESRFWEGGNPIKEIMSALKDNMILKMLNLSGCFPSYPYYEEEKHFIHPIMETLQHNSTLKELNLSCNAIKDKEALLIAKALETNSTLSLLNLEHTNIKKQGKMAIREVVKTKDNLEVIL